MQTRRGMRLSASARGKPNNLAGAAGCVRQMLSAVLLSMLACGSSYAHQQPKETDSPLIVLGISPLRADSYERILAILLEDAAHSRREDGIISWDLFRPEDGARDLFAVERYRDQATFDRHVQAPYVKVFIDNIDAAVREGEPQSAIFMKELLPSVARPIASPQTTKNVISVLSLRQDAASATVSALLSAARAARAADGNLVYDVFQDRSDPNRLVVFQRWANAGAYEAYHARTGKPLDDLLNKALAENGRSTTRAVRDIGY